MPTLFKPTRPYPLPVGAEIIQKDGKPHVRLKDRGKEIFYPVTDNGKQYLKPASKWAADVRFADGRRKRVRFSANHEAAVVMLANLLKKIENEKAGIRNDHVDHIRRPLSDLLVEYRRYVLDKGATQKESGQTTRRCEIVFEGCGFLLLADLNAAAAERWLAERRLPRHKGGFGPASSNHYAKSLKAFGNWLLKTRRVAENPFQHLARVNAALDIRHRRRPLSNDEFTRLLVSTENATPFRRLSGRDRKMLYLIAGAPGLRASELASLTPDSFATQSDPPVVAVEAAYSKHRRRDEVPLHPALLHELRPWLATKTKGGLLWPGPWAKNNEAGDMIRRDLDTARAAWIDEAESTAEKRQREAADFLAYRDSEGRVPTSIRFDIASSPSW